MLLQQTCSQGLFNVCVVKCPTCEGFVSLVFLLQIIFKHFIFTVVVFLIQALRVEMFEQGANMTKTLYYCQCHMTSMVSVLALGIPLGKKVCIQATFQAHFSGVRFLQGPSGANLLYFYFSSLSSRCPFFPPIIRKLQQSIASEHASISIYV